MHGATLYVGVGGTDNACTTSSAPCGSIKAALTLAGDGTEIIVLPGNYPALDNGNLTVSSLTGLKITGSGQGVTNIDLGMNGTWDIRFLFGTAFNRKKKLCHQTSATQFCTHKIASRVKFRSQKHTPEIS